jgi:Fe-S-cluster containining protein
MNQCATCHAGCCRSFAVPVSGADILQIARAHQISFWDFVWRWADPHGLVARKYAPHFYFRDEPETPFTICLKPRESTSHPGTTCCTFLVEGAPTAERPLGISSCGIYDDRPSACRAFPTRLNQSGELAVLHDVPVTARPGGHEAYRLCERPWQPFELDPIRQVQALVVAQFEMKFFWKVAEGWNQNPGDWSAFPEFLELVYANRVCDAETAEQLDSTAATESEVSFPRLAA